MGIFFKKKPDRAEKKPERTEGGELLFCLPSTTDELLAPLEALFHVETGKKGNWITLRRSDRPDMVLTFAAFGLNDEGERSEYAKQQLQGIQGFYRRVETQHKDVKLNLLYHLRQCKGVIQVHYEMAGTDKEEFLFPVLQAVRALGGLVTWSGGTSILNGDGRMILDQRGASQVEYYMPVEQVPPPDFGGDLPPACRQRRDQSVELLRQRHIYVTPWLPLLEDRDTPARTVREICGRAGALLVVSLYSECRLGEKMDYQAAKDFVQGVTEAYHAEEFFSPKERAYLDDPDSTEQAQIQFAWQYENLWVMEWALGLLDTLPWPDQICDVPASARIMREHPSLEALEQAAELREVRDLLDMADLIYRTDWACVDARVMGLDAPAGLDSGVVQERHRALFWLAGCDHCCGWDDVDLST